MIVNHIYMCYCYICVCVIETISLYPRFYILGERFRLLVVPEITKLIHTAGVTWRCVISQMYHLNLHTFQVLQRLYHLNLHRDPSNGTGKNQITSAVHDKSHFKSLSFKLNPFSARCFIHRLLSKFPVIYFWRWFVQSNRDR